MDLYCVRLKQQRHNPEQATLINVNVHLIKIAAENEI